MIESRDIGSAPDWNPHRVQLAMPALEALLDRHANAHDLGSGLLAKLDEVLNHRVRTIEVVLPYDKLALADILRSRGSVAAEEYREDGVYYRGTVKIDDLHRFEEFLV